MLPSSLIDVPSGELAAAVTAGDVTRRYLRDWLALVPDPRPPLGRWHRLEFVLALAVCAFTAAGHDSPVAIAEWAANCSRQALLILGGRADPLTMKVRAPSVRTFSRVLAKIDADALNAALYGFLEEMPTTAPETLPRPHPGGKSDRRQQQARVADRADRRQARAAAPADLPGAHP